MLPEALVMLPGALVMLPDRLVMFPANAEDETANAKRDAQRIDLKRFILILLVIERLLGRTVRRDCHLRCPNSRSNGFDYQLVRRSLFQGSCQGSPLVIWAA
jgi:hypothetical protein